MTDQPNELILLGRLIGTFTGWDDGGEEQIMFYDFVPNETAIATNQTIFQTTQSCLSFNHSLGTLSIFDDDGNEHDITDAIEALKNTPRHTPTG